MTWVKGQSAGNVGEARRFYLDCLCPMHPAEENGSFYLDLQTLLMWVFVPKASKPHNEEP